MSPAIQGHEGAITVGVSEGHLSFNLDPIYVNAGYQTESGFDGVELALLRTDPKEKYLLYGSIGQILLGSMGRFKPSDIGGLPNSFLGISLGLTNFSKTNRSGFEMTLVSEAASYSGVYIGGLLFTERDIRGIQAGLGVASEGNMTGGQVGVVGVTSEGNMTGGQVGLVVASEGNMTGGQVGVVVGGLHGNMTGGQVGVVVGGLHGNMTGGQVGGIAVVSGENMTGGQIGAIAVVSREDMTGGQIGGIAVVSRGNMIGGQVGGVVRAYNMIGGQVGLGVLANRDITGFQAGLYVGSEEGSLHGFQIGLVTYSKEKASGLQLGVVTIEEGFYKLFGLIPVYDDGSFRSRIDNIIRREVSMYRFGHVYVGNANDAGADIPKFHRQK